MNAEDRDYRAARRACWDAVFRTTAASGRAGRYYHELLRRYYRLLVPEGLKVLEIGCGQGDLLAALNGQPGIGIDFSEAVIRAAAKKHPELLFICADAHALPLAGAVDVIILSDLINDLWDIQAVFSAVARLCHPGTRIIINFFNNMWRLPVTIARKSGLAADLLEQNWLAPDDVANLLRLSGLEPVTFSPQILLPLPWPLLAPLSNRWLVKFPPFRWLALTNFITARPEPAPGRPSPPPVPAVSLIIPAKNEAGNIEPLLHRINLPDDGTELIFIEGGSSDNTHETIRNAVRRHPGRTCRLLRQSGQGKGDAVRQGCEAAGGDIIVILDADLTVPPETIPRFIEALVSGKGEFINGVRLVYPLEGQSMRFLNMVANKCFSLIFSWLLGQPVKDTLCGTKALWRRDYLLMEKGSRLSRKADPFGDFYLLFNAAMLNLKIVDLPVRYRRRTYGQSNIRRWEHGWSLLKMTALAAVKIKFR